MEIKNLFFLRRLKAIIVLGTVFILFAGVSVEAQESDIEKIVKEVSVDSQKGAILSYSYLMKFFYHRHKIAGRRFTRLYEAIIPSRFSFNRMYTHPLILLEDSERKISEEEIKMARLAIAKDIEKIENEADKKPNEKDKPVEDGGYWTIGFSANSQQVKVDVLQLLKNARLSNLQRKQIDGTNVVSIDFTPNASAVFEKPLSYLAKIEGQIWIDETAKRIIRVEGFAPGAFEKLKERPDAERQKEAVFLFLQTRVAEGFWFPQTVRLNFDKHPEIFEAVELEFTFTNYRKGSVDIQYTEAAGKETSPKSEKQ